MSSFVSSFDKIVGIVERRRRERAMRLFCRSSSNSWAFRMFRYCRRAATSHANTILEFGGHKTEC
jgi:hypothetical protein